MVTSRERMERPRAAGRGEIRWWEVTSLCQVLCRGEEGEEGRRAPSKRPLEYEIPRIVAAAMAPLLTEEGRGRRRSLLRDGRNAAKICMLPQTTETRRREDGEVLDCATSRQIRGEMEGVNDVRGEKRPQRAWWRAREEMPA